MFERSYYEEAVKKAEKNNQIVVLKGVRAAGKMSFLRSFLKKSGQHVIEIDFDKTDAEHLKADGALRDYLKDTLIMTSSSAENRTAVLVGEAEEAVNGLEQLAFVQKTSYCQVYATVSRGPLIEDCTCVDFFPLSFREYMEIGNRDREERERFLLEYLSSTSFIAPHRTDDIDLQENILGGIRDSIFLNDILLTGAIKNVEAFRRVQKFLMENIASQISAYNISQELTSQGFKIASDTADGYLKLLCDCNLASYCERYDIKKHEFLKTNGRYFIADLSLRESFVGKRNPSMVNLLKNVVYYELRRRNDQVNTGWNPEIDFIARKGNNLSYYMVNATVDDRTVLQKQLDVLSSIRDNYPKYILSLDNTDYSSNGIIHMNIADFLLQ